MREIIAAAFRERGQRDAGPGRFGGGLDGWLRDELADCQGHTPEAIQAKKAGLERLEQAGVEADDD